MRRLHALADLLPGPACPPRPYTPLCILSTARSGSTLLVHTLRAHPDVLMYGEAFSPLEQVRRIAMWRPDRSAPAYDGGSVRRFLRETLFPPVETGRRVAGFKLFTGHAEWLPSPERFWQLLESVPNLKVLHLERQNLLDIVLSLRLAVRDEAWFEPQGLPRTPREAIRIDEQYCVGAFHRLAREQEECRRRLAGADRLQVTYDALVYDTQACMHGIHAWLGLPPGPVQPLDGPAKQRTVSRREAIANFDALRSRFEAEKPEWLRYFDEPEPFLSQ